MTHTRAEMQLMNTVNKELPRIADALERIATSLEEVTEDAESTERVVFADTPIPEGDPDGIRS